MPRTKLHATVQKHKAKSKGDRPSLDSIAIALDIETLDWKKIDSLNPFILEPGVPLFE